MGLSNDSSDRKPGKYRILVAEDNERIRGSIVRILVGDGHQAHAVDNGNDALAELCRGIYDLAVLDVRMPGLTAVEITQQYRATHERPIPIIVLTADTTAKTGLNCLVSGVDVVLSKPVRIQELLDAVAQAGAGQRIEPPPARPAHASGTILDEGTLADLAHNDPNVEFRRRFFGKFINAAHGMVRDAEKALSANDFQAADFVIHKLKNAAGTAGAVAVMRICDALAEDFARGSVSDLSAQLDALRQAVSDVEKELDTKYDIRASKEG